MFSFRDIAGKLTSVTTATPLPVNVIGGGGSSGAVTIADGANVTQGALADSAYASTNGSASGTLNGILKGLYVRLAGILSVGGSVAAGAADTGNPVKVGGTYTAADPALTDGQRGNLRLTAKGAAVVNVVTSDGYSLLNANFVGGDSIGGFGSVLKVYGPSMYAMGATLYLARGNAAGAWNERTAIFAETATALAASATLTGVARDNGAITGADGTRFKNFVAEVFTDQAGTLYIDKSVDGTTWRQAATLAVVANVNATLESKITCRYYRLRYINGATLQTVFLPTCSYTV